jgi:hypothetical protein
MHQPVSIAALLFAVCGCAATPDPPAAPAAATDVAARSSADPEIVAVRQVDIAQFREEKLHCEDLTRPGSRIVVARRCRSIDEEALADQLNQVRREQDMLDRLARERENRRGGP